MRTSERTLEAGDTTLEASRPLLDSGPRRRIMTSRCRQTFWITSTLAFSIVAVVLWIIFLRENFHTVVAGELYRSAQPNDSMLQRFQEGQGIRSVINLRGTWAGESWFDNEVATSRRLGLELRNIDLATFNLAPPEDLRKLVAAFDECRRPILLHCRHGADRTSLAVAMYHVLYQNATPEEAMSAYQIKCGHTGLAFGRHLPHLFETYGHWLSQRQKSHSSAAFREWIAGLESVGQYGARIEIADHSTVADGPVGVTFRVTNTSAYAWRMKTDTQDGIYALVRLSTAEGEDLASEHAYSWEKNAASGQSVLMHVTLPCPPAGGKFQIRAELVDEHGFRFGRLGCNPLYTTLEILPANVLATATTSRTANLGKK